MTVRADCAVSAFSPLPLPIGSSSPIVGVGSHPLEMVVHPPASLLPASEKEQTFLSTNLASLLTLEQPVDNPQFWQQFSGTRSGTAVF